MMFNRVLWTRLTRFLLPHTTSHNGLVMIEFPWYRMIIELKFRAKFQDDLMATQSP